MCNRVGIIDKGELKAEGTMQELLAAQRGLVEVEIGVVSRPAALAALARIEGAELVGDGEDGRLLVNLRGVEVAAFNRALVQADVEVHTLLHRTRSLEDFFLEVTGQDPELQRPT